MTFLQGQLTNDLTSLAIGQARLAGYCSPKGRLLASLVVWRTGPQDWLLACSADVLAATLKRLSMFVLRAQCKLSDVSAQHPLSGCVGPLATAWLGAAAPSAAWSCAAHGSAWVVRLPDVQGQARYLYAGPAPEGLPALPPTAWRWLEVASGIPRIVAATREAFVPQMINFELVGGVSFKKGCYPGQEVVARSQYRGTLKRRGALVHSPVALVEGQEVFHDADPGQPAGQVALAAEAGDGQFLALIEIKRAALSGGTLHLGSVEGATLTAMALPYAIPQDEN